MSLLYLLALLVASIGSVIAQTSTTCNPLNATCPADTALGTTYTGYFNQTADTKIWTLANSAQQITFNPDGVNFTISDSGQSPRLQSTFYIFFGRVESWVKMAKGPGIVSSIVLISDDLDEIDWEWVGYNTSQVQTNYFGKGNTSTFDRGAFFDLPNVDTEFHNYTTVWTADKLEWWADGVCLRTLNYADALGGQNYPQTPCTLSYGIWPGGDPSVNSKGTVEWAGGPVDYNAGPYNMVVANVSVQDYHTGKEYTYSDHSGTWQSITVADGNSTVANEINNPPKSLAEKWAALPTTVKDGVYIGAAVFVALCGAAFIFFFIRQRRRGRLEYALEDAKWNTERTEMNNHQSDWKQSEWSTRGGGYQQVN